MIEFQQQIYFDHPFLMHKTQNTMKSQKQPNDFIHQNKQNQLNSVKNKLQKDKREIHSQKYTNITQMNSISTLGKRVLQQQLAKNQNPPGYKMVIAEVMKGIEDRAYWYFTTDEAEFLSNVYVKEVEEQSLRNRLKQITDDAMNCLLEQIISGQVGKVTPQNTQLVTTVKILQKVQTIAQQGHDYYSAQHPVARQTIEKIRMINQDYKSFKQRIEQIKQKERQRKLQKQQMERQIQQKIAEEKKLQYHKEVMKRLQIMRLKQEQRNEQNQKFKHFLKQFKKSKPLHLLMEEEYKEKIELPQLQESRKKLELFKHKKKPTLQEINDHQRAFMTLKESRPEKTFAKHHTIDVGYKSEFYKKVQEETKNGYEDEYSSMVWDQMEKKKRYSMMVKENFKPKTSRVLHESLDESQKRNSQRKIAPDLSRVKQIGKFYLQYVKSLQKNRSNTAIDKQQDTQQQGKMSRSRYTNYLEELKRSHQSSRYKGFGANWQVDLNDRTASKSEKRDRVLIKSKQLEEKAMRDEMLVKNFNYGKAEQIIGKKKEIDETLLESIKAKMALLKEVKSQ